MIQKEYHPSYNLRSGGSVIERFKTCPTMYKHSRDADDESNTCDTKRKLNRKKVDKIYLNN